MVFNADNTRSRALSLLRRPVAAAGALLCWSADCALAQTPSLSQQDELVIVTGSRTPGATAPAQSHIDAAEIAARAPASTADLMRQAPGGDIVQPGGAGSVSELFLRGAESNFAVVLLDGVRLSDPTDSRGGGFDFSAIELSEIERIDIVRGAVSAVHGSDAMSGVVAITTRDPAEAQSRAFAEFGADNHMRAGVGLAENLGGAHLDVFGAVSHREGRAGASQDFAGAGARVSSRDGVLNWRAGARYAERSRQGFPEASGGPLFALSRELEHVDASDISLWWNGQRTIGAGSQAAVTLTYFGRDETTDTPAIAPGIFDGVPASFSEAQLQRGELTVSFSTEASSQVELVVGGQVRAEDGKRSALINFGGMDLASEFDIERTTWGAFAEATWRPTDAFSAHAALRIDTDDAETRASGRLALAYSPRQGQTIIASWANGHKQPGFYALGDALVGNPDLKVETSETAELRLEQEVAPLQGTLSMSVFASSYEDLIDFDFATFSLVNRARVEITGVELAATGQLTPSLLARAHLSASDIDLPGGPLLRRTERRAGVVLEWRPDSDWVAQINAQFVGPRPVSSTPTGFVELDAYERLDISLSRNISAGARIYASADNVLSATYAEAAGFETDDIIWRVGVAKTW